MTTTCALNPKDNFSDESKYCENALNAKKTFLLRFIDNEREITRLEEEIEMWESRAQRVTASFSFTAAGGKGEDRIQRATDSLVELRAMLYDKLLDSTEIRLEIERCLASIKDDRLRLLMEYRYINGLTWEQVAETMHCEYRWILRLHKRALALIEPSEKYI